LGGPCGPAGSRECVAEQGICRICMKKLAVEKALRWMLAAWTLVAFVSAAPTVVHSHSDGYRSHQHDPAARVPDGLTQSLTPRALQDGCEGGSHLSAADFHKHGGVWLLGFVKYLPTPTKPVSSDSESRCCGSEPMPVVVSAQGWRACSNGVAGDYLQSVSLAALSVECICQSGQQETPVLGVAPSAPLCDRARHERSGVLLA
jgi:hypothetical protein